MKTQYPMIPFPLIVKATDGDTEAINQILHHYRGYITKRSLRLMKDEYAIKVWSLMKSYVEEWKPD